LLVYAREITPRLNYIFEFIISQILKLDLEITDDSEQFAARTQPKINYSDRFFDGSFRIKPANLLFEKEITEQDLYFPVWKDIKVMYLTDPLSDIPFDPFAASFFMLSRYEEYLYTEPDLHGRYNVYDSLAYRNDFLNSPVVDLWIVELRKSLVKKFPRLRINQKTYEFMPTIDVDEPFAFKCKGLIRTIGGMMHANTRKIKGENLLRLNVLIGKRKDPYDTFDLLQQWHGKHKCKPVYFFQVGKVGKYDKNPPGNRRAYMRLIKNTAGKYAIGIHPSYRSNTEPPELEKEISLLQMAACQPITRSRQHYLKLQIPFTCRNLLRLGVKEDYTMGYAAETGFRAGTSNSFLFYDLLKEEKTELRIFPFQVMDGTLKDYLRMDQQEALERIKQIVDIIKTVNGTFISLWHNSSLSDWGPWEGWREVYREMLKIAGEGCAIGVPSAKGEGCGSVQSSVYRVKNKYRISNKE